jgi:hypothetical protein
VWSEQYRLYNSSLGCEKHDSWLFSVIKPNLTYSACHHFTDTLSLGEKKIVEIVPIMLMYITGEKNVFDVEKIFSFSH